MKKVIKLIKNNILGFIIGAIIFTGVGVSAATYLYNSNQVSYSNSNSSVTDVKGALDELYKLSANSVDVSEILSSVETGINSPVTVYNYSYSFGSAWQGETVTGSYDVVNTGLYKVTSTADNTNYSTGIHYIENGTTVYATSRNNSADAGSSSHTISASLKVEKIYTID